MLILYQVGGLLKPLQQDWEFQVMLKIIIITI